MERTAMAQLVAWKASQRRKPLLVQGVRQCGKTYLLKEFGKQSFSNLAYINFDENPERGKFFEMSKDPQWIIQNLAFATATTIVPGETLIVLDEIQEAPAALSALKYFAESAPDFHVAAAGSLLGVTLARPGSFPVGKVDFLDLHPMTFTEWLLATGQAGMVAAMRAVNSPEPLPVAFHDLLIEQLKTYLITGGMPEPVSLWAESKDIAGVQSALASIITAYERDFAKHLPTKDIPKANAIWGSIPSQLSRENKKFIYQSVKPGARAREYEDALQWLVDAGLISKIFRSRGVGLPISAYDDLSAFKLYLADVGLLRRLSRLDPAAFTEDTRLFTEFRGALSENYALQAMLVQLDVVPRYWAQQNPAYEVDFLIQRGNDIFPVEVKSGTHVASKSLIAFNRIFPGKAKLRVRFSLANLRLDGDVLNVPLYLADHLDRIIGLALDR